MRALLRRTLPESGLNVPLRKDFLSRHSENPRNNWPMKILVVDDERAVRESLRRALELEGYDIELAADGGEALYRLEAPNEEPDAMILDVLMPGIDGLEVCRRLR